MFAFLIMLFEGGLPIGVSFSMFFMFGHVHITIEVWSFISIDWLGVDFSSHFGSFVEGIGQARLFALV